MHEHAFASYLVIRGKGFHCTGGKGLQKLVLVSEFHSSQSLSPRIIPPVFEQQFRSCRVNYCGGICVAQVLYE